MKKTIILIFSFLIFSILVSYSLVYGKWTVLGNIKAPDIISNNIFQGSPLLNYTIVSYNTNEDLSSFKLKSNCNISSRFLGKKKDKNYFKIVFLDNKCKYQNIYLEKGKKSYFDTKFSLKIFSSGKIFGLLSDIDNNLLNKLKIKFNNEIKIYKLSKNKNLGSDLNIFRYIKKQRAYEELLYKKKILDRVLNKRKNKYISPINGYIISTKASKLPNTGRPYRSKYTDGIHHGWDVDSPFGSEVRTIDDGVVVRIIKDYHYSNLNKIKYGNNLTNEDKLRNLNLLRGNQVWFKTAKGDVIFYSHLSKVYDNIKVGDLLPVNFAIGKTGITGVPDKSYNDYHLHFAIQKNPYNIKKVGNYTYMDYMKWDWYFRGKNEKFILKNQGNVFKLDKNLTNEKKKLK